MQLHEEIKVFNKNLEGKAVYIKGLDRFKEIYDGFYLVKSIDYIEMYAIDKYGKTHVFNLHDFEGYGNGSLELTVFEKPEIQNT